MKKGIQAGIVMILLLLGVSVTQADQASYISREAGSRAVELLGETSQLYLYCAPCGDEQAEPVTVTTLANRPVNYKNFWQVKLNGEGIDLAYTYYPVEGRWRNVGLALGLDVVDVPEFLSPEMLEEVQL